MEVRRPIVKSSYRHQRAIMILTAHRLVGWRTLCLHGLMVIIGLIAAATTLAQEGKPAGEVAKPATEAKLPEVIEALMPSIVTVTRIEPAGGDPANKPVSHAGVVVDARGYIVIPLLPSQSKLKLFVVRFADQREVVGQLVAVDESLKFGVLKIESAQPVAAFSFARSREARVDDRVRVVPSPASRELRGGRVTSTTFALGGEGSPKLIQTDLTFPLSEYGSVMVSEAGEPLGILMASRASPKPESIVLPVIVVPALLKATIDKPKGVPVVTVPVSPPPVDLRKSPQVELLLKSGIGSFEPGPTTNVADWGKPVQISLQPATPLAKLLVEHFGTRGAQILDYEEGNRLKIEAPPLVLVELGELLAGVFRDAQKQESKTEPV